MTISLKTTLHQRRYKSPWLFIFVLALAGFCSLSCSKKTADSLIIPVFLPLTGPISVYGQWTKDAMTIAAEEVNSKSDLKLIFDYIDTKGMPKDSISAYHQIQASSSPPLIVVAITGPVIALAPLTDARDQVLFATVVTYPDITMKGSNIFRHFINKGEGALVLAKAARSAKINELSVVYINEDGGLAEKVAFVSAFKAAGGTVRSEYTFEKTTIDFRDILAKIRGNGDSTLVLSGYGAAYAYFLKQLHEQPAPMKVLTSCDVVDPYVVAIAGKPSPGTIYYNPMYDESNPSHIAFRTRYYAKYGKEPPFYSGFGYDIPFMIKKAIETQQSRTDATSIRSGLLALTNFQGAYGVVNVGADRDTHFTYRAFEIDMNGNPKSF